MKTYVEQWRQLMNTSNTDEFTELTNEIQNAVKDVEWDLADLEDTIKIVEMNRDKFMITPQELQSRQQFILTTRSYIAGVKDEVSRGSKAKLERDQRDMLMKTRKQEALANTGMDDKYAKFAGAISRDNDDFISSQSQKQEQIRDTTNRNLDVLSTKVQRLEEVSLTLSDELARQNEELELEERELEATESQMKRSIKTLNDLIDRMDDRKLWGIICTMFLILVVLVFVVVFV